MPCPVCANPYATGTFDCTRCRDSGGGMTPQQAESLQGASEGCVISLAKASFWVFLSRPAAFFWFWITLAGLVGILGVWVGGEQLGLFDPADVDAPNTFEGVPYWLLVISALAPLPLTWALRPHIPKYVPWLVGAALVLAFVDWLRS